MTRDELIEEFGSIEAAKEAGYVKAPFSNNWVKTQGLSSSKKRNYQGKPYGKSSPNNADNNDTKSD